MGVKAEWIGARKDKGLRGGCAQKIITHTHWRGVWREMAPNALGDNLLSKTVIPYIENGRFRFPAKREVGTANSLFEKRNSFAILFRYGFEPEADFTAVGCQGLSWTSRGRLNIMASC